MGFARLIIVSSQKPVLSFLQIPFYPVVARDLTFTHEGNDDKVEGLINFEKLRMISRYIRDLQNMCSAPYVSCANVACNYCPLDLLISNIIFYCHIIFNLYKIIY